MNFKIVVSDPGTRKSYSKEVPQEASMLFGKKIRETFEGNSLGLPGFKLEITGGSDKDGFPMRKDMEGTARKKILLSSPPGYHPQREGERKRKSIRGNTISADIVQVNLKVLEHGKQTLDEAFGKKAEEKKEKPEEKKGQKSEAKEQEEKPKTEKKKEEKPEEQAKTEKKEDAPKDEIEEKPKEGKEHKPATKEDKPKAEEKESEENKGQKKESKGKEGK